MEAAWPGQAVEESNLTVQIAALRRVLGEVPGGKDWILTLPRRGYRFVGPMVGKAEDSGVIERQKPAAPLPALERGHHPLSARPNSSGELPTGSTDLSYAASDPGSVVEEVDRDLLVGERKYVTVLCADLKDSLERLAEGDSEKALEIFEATLTLMRQTVHRYGGTVNIVTGDGIVAVFGAPVALEDHAIRACFAALEIREAIQRSGHGVDDPGSPPVLVRAGLSSGEVVTRLIGNGGDTQYRAIGPSAHLAARLGQIAPPGTLLVSAGTLRLVEGHVQVKALEVANAPSGQLVYELVGAEPAKSRFKALASRGLTSFVGRDTELEQLERLAAKARRGQGQVTAIIGEPGLGKSRLVHEFVRRERMSSWLVLETASLSYRSATSYQPVIDLLKTYFGIAESDEVAKRRNKVTDRLLGLDRALAPDLPAFLVLLDIPMEERSWQELNASQRRERILAGLKRLILR